MVTLQHGQTVKGRRSPPSRPPSCPPHPYKKKKIISAPLFVPVSGAREAWPLQIKSRRFIKMAERRVARDARLSIRLRVACALFNVRVRNASGSEWVQTAPRITKTIHHYYYIDYYVVFFFKCSTVHTYTHFKALPKKGPRENYCL